MRNIFYLIAFIFTNGLLAQSQEEYSNLTNEALKLYSSGNYKVSAKKYSEAFSKLGGKAFPNDRYNAACSYAMAKERDSAFYHLFRLANNEITKYSNYNHIKADPDLNFLHADKRWDKLIVIVKRNKEELEKDLNKPLVAILDTIYQSDQGLRLQIDDIEKTYGKDSPEVKEHWKLINKFDSLNTIKVIKILDERGWLGPSVIGKQGSSTIFLVIQHASLSVQKKYLPMMQEAVKKGDAEASSMAMLVDRIEMREGRKQIYGSQIWWDFDLEVYCLFPVVDPENINKRREDVGLGRIESYLSNWNITWNIQKHKERILKWEKEKDKYNFSK